jgi:hypothetical protein
MRRKYALDQLRSMLVGKRWCDFKKPKAYKSHRFLSVKNVYFTLVLTKFMLRPALRIKADGQFVVLQFIPKSLLEEYKTDFNLTERWNMYTGYVLTDDTWNKMEANEPVEAAQNVA